MCRHNSGSSIEYLLFFIKKLDLLPYRKGYSTATALTQMTDDWLRRIEEKKIIGAVLLDFTVAFVIMDHEILSKEL